jgi:hypothetical protein
VRLNNKEFMSKKIVVCLGVVLNILLSYGVAFGQSNSLTERRQLKEVTEGSEDRFVAQLAEVQSQVLSILRKAQFNGDLQTALGAASEARANVELMAALSGRLPVAERPPARTNVYLIAFKDHVIRAVVDYSVEGTTLSYVTLQGTRAQAPLDSVDREFSEQLNRERNIEFRLPPPK